MAQCMSMVRGPPIRGSDQSSLSDSLVVSVGGAFRVGAQGTCLWCLVQQKSSSWVAVCESYHRTDRKFLRTLEKERHFFGGGRKSPGQSPRGQKAPEACFWQSIKGAFRSKDQHSYPAVVAATRGAASVLCDKGGSGGGEQAGHRAQHERGQGRANGSGV